MIIKRVLHYAHPYRAQIILALGLGMLAGLLTAVNLLALIPVLKIVLDESGDEHIVEMQADLDEAQSEFDQAEGFFGTIDPWINLKKQEIRHHWTFWVTNKKEKAIYIMAIFLVVSQLIKAVIEFASKYSLQRCFYMAVVRMRIQLYTRCLYMDMPEFSKITSGDLISRLNNDMRAIRTVFSNLLSTVALQPFNVVFLLVAMLILNWRLTLIAAIGIPLVLGPISLISKRLRTMGKKDEEEDAKILSYSQETIQGLMMVKAFNGEKRETKKFRELSKNVAIRQIRREKFRLYSEPFVEIVGSFAMAGVLCVGAFVIMKSGNAGMSPFEFLAYLAIMTRFYPPFKRVMSAFVKMQKSLASAERVFEIIDLEPSIKEKPDATVLKSFEQGIEFKDVTFAYNKEKGNVLKNFSLSLPKGKKIALVGRTGSGKSTAARLLPRLYDADSGTITFDGEDIRDVTIKSLRGLMAIVSQDTILFNDSIMNNIRYGRPSATDQEVVEAANAAYAHEFIDKLPQGYETVIGERGGQLSGGQRQRLAIARALLANTPILLLDEATSALDNESERIVQQAIERLMENRTVLVIAHRLSTVRKADEIVVIDNGEIAEQGTHNELLKKQGKYYTLLQAEELVSSSED